MSFVLVVVAGLLFGALDQYLGTIHVTSRLGDWTITVSQMSAPWLVLPFVVGATQERRRRAVVFGLVATFSALLGYFAMSNSPFESVPIDRFAARMSSMVTGDYNLLWILGGAVTGPLFGYLGHRWRVARSWVGPVLISGALCLEAFARVTVGRPFFGDLGGAEIVWAAEVGVGMVVAIVFARAIAVSRRSEPPPVAAR